MGKSTSTRKTKQYATDEDLSRSYEMVEAACGVECAALYIRWMEYKDQRGQRYTPMGANATAKIMVRWWLEGWDLEYAMDRAMGQNWMGFDFDASKRKRLRTTGATHADS